ncbi:MAG TPA: HlyD family efflux transporter periplasmic adaptor subunit [Chitinophagaceae bacterium]|nr:HlyD family efflux transporter periplasmic adaptor subunit [Chitinophagaceae bacterium]
MAIDFIHQDMAHQCEKLDLKSYNQIYRIRKKSYVKRWVISFLICLGIILFLPWTQNIRARGSVTTLRQEQRPQQFPTIIPGRVVKWHVKEGDYVKKGDTLVQIGEIKDDYLDPSLVKRTGEQLDAKKQANESYQSKVNATGQQIAALAEARDLKMAELDNKIDQQLMKIRSDSADLVAVQNDLNIKAEQFKRQRVMYDSGLASLVQLEQRNQAFQEATAKKMSAEIKFSNAKQELIRLKIERNGEMQQYAEKISKAEGDRFQSISQIQTGQGEIAKLENQYMNYNIRSGLYTLIAPQDGQVVQAKKAGIGEILKEGDVIVEIIPTNVEYAVEMFVKPVDLPLISKGQKVMFLFDGFPAVVFSGWPNASYGIFAGEVAAVESGVGTNGKFRLLVKEKPGEKPWPRELMMGTGAQGIALLKDVPIWYELWRNINGFPPDYYKSEVAVDNKLTGKK